MTDLMEMVEWLRREIGEDKRLATRAAELCGCHPSAPSWTFGDETTDGRIVIVDDPHPDIRRKLNRRWNSTYEGLFAAEHIVRHDPRDTIARCEAELEILEIHSGRHSCGALECDDDDPCPTQRALASGYRHRDGYKASWTA